MKDREEYLIKHQEGLLEKLAESFSSLNKNILAGFSLLFVFLLFRLNILEQAVIEGVKLKVTQDQALVLFPIIICIPFFLVNNTIYRISTIIDILKSNSDEIQKLNNSSRPFELKDLYYWTTGIAGLQLSLSSWIVKNLLRNKLLEIDMGIPAERSLLNIVRFSLMLPINVFRNLNRLGSRILYTIFYLSLLVVIYILPLVISIIILYSDKVSIILKKFQFPNDVFNIFLWEALLLLFLIVYTLITNLFLYSFYFTKLTELKDDLVRNGYQNLLKVFTNVVKFYRRR